MNTNIGGRRTIVHIVDQPVPPVLSSGGSNRVVFWLAREQARAGHNVYVMSYSGSSTEHFQHIKINREYTYEQIEKEIPSNTTDIEIHNLPAAISEPLLTKFKVSIKLVHTGSDPGIRRVYVSRNHAERSSGTVFAHNGVPEEDYEFCDIKQDYLLFLAKVKRS
jgi:hypothetical protein